MNGRSGRGRRTNLHNFNPLTLQYQESNQTVQARPPLSTTTLLPGPRSLSRVIIKALMTS